MMGFAGPRNRPKPLPESAAITGVDDMLATLVEPANAFLSLGNQPINVLGVVPQLRIGVAPLLDARQLGQAGKNSLAVLDCPIDTRTERVNGQVKLTAYLRLPRVSGLT